MIQHSVVAWFKWPDPGANSHYHRSANFVFDALGNASLVPSKQKLDCFGVIRTCVFSAHLRFALNVIGSGVSVVW